MKIKNTTKTFAIALTMIFALTIAPTMAFDFAPFFRVYGLHYFVSSRCSQARAASQSRATVAREICSASAVSSKLKPLK